jgi:two-component system, NarL family, sensor kinase
MSSRPKTRKRGTEDINTLRYRLTELEETLRAIRRGEVDALVVSEGAANRVYTLQGAEHPYRVMVQAMNEGAATLTQEGVVLFANPRLAEMLRRPPERLVGASLWDLVQQLECEDRDQLMRRVQNKAIQVECVLHVAGGRSLPVYLSFSPLRENGFRGICVIATDLTGQKKRAKELADANDALRNEVAHRLRAEEALRREEESLRQLSARLLTLQDEERRRIARDLHESTGQKVAALCLDLTLAMQLAGQLPPTAREALQQSLVLAEEITADIRTMAYLLHPPLLDEVGLRSAARWYVEGFIRRTRIEVDLELPSKLPRLPADVEIALFRVLQEGLTNVHRHSGSATASVRFSLRDNSVDLEIEDHGEPTQQQSQRLLSQNIQLMGVGIRGMRERVRQLGGALEIKSTGAGTTIVASLPLKNSRRQPGPEGLAS